MQQCYNVADTLIVGQCIGAGALAAVGSAYTLMVFLISVLLGLAMGSGTVFSLHYGAGNHVALRRSIFSSFVLIGIVTLILNVAVFIWLDPILRLLQVPQDIYGMMRSYLWIIFCGIVFTFIYNFYAALLRAVGDSVTPLWFLAVSVVLNIALDLFLSFNWIGASKVQPLPRSLPRAQRHWASLSTRIDTVPNCVGVARICASTVPACRKSLPSLH